MFHRLGKRPTKPVPPGGTHGWTTEGGTCVGRQRSARIDSDSTVAGLIPPMYAL